MALQNISVLYSIPPAPDFNTVNLYSLWRVQVSFLFWPLAGFGAVAQPFSETDSGLFIECCKCNNINALLSSYGRCI